MTSQWFNAGHDEFDTLKPNENEKAEYLHTVSKATKWSRKRLAADPDSVSLKGKSVSLLNGAAMNGSRKKTATRVCGMFVWQSARPRTFLLTLRSTWISGV